jgi:uncharacterized membrane protein YgcG
VVRGSFVVLGALALLLAGAGPAAAEPPVSVSDRITDDVDVLGDEQTVRAAIEDLTADSEIDLYVVFVSSFDTGIGTDWIEETARLSELEGSDILLAVAVGDETYEYGWWVDDSFALSQVDLENIMTTEVVPEFESGNWDTGSIALAEQLRSMTVLGDEETQTPAWSVTTTMLVVVGLAVVLFGAHLFSRRRTPAVSSRQPTRRHRGSGRSSPRLPHATRRQASSKRAARAAVRRRLSR